MISILVVYFSNQNPDIALIISAQWDILVVAVMKHLVSVLLMWNYHNFVVIWFLTVVGSDILVTSVRTAILDTLRATVSVRKLATNVLETASTLT